MGIIKRQSIFYTVISYIGLGIGAINTLLLMPHFLTQEQVGLIGIFSAIAFPLAAISNVGSIFAINRFLPYYKKELSPAKIDLPMITVVISLIGFLVTTALAYSGREYIFDWFEHAPLLLEYFHLLPIFMLGYLLCSIFQALNNGYFQTVWVGFVTEVVFRVYHMILIVLFVVNLFTFDQYLFAYVLMFWIGIILYIGKLKSVGPWFFFTRISLLTRKIKRFIFQYSSYFWLTSVFAVMATMIDSVVLAGVNGLAKTGSLMIATYFITVTQIPQRGIVSVSVPVIAESWRKRDMANLGRIYIKSANNMMWSGGFIFLAILICMNELLSFLPGAYHEIKWVVPVLGLAKLIDYATGVNQNILSLSRKNWKWDFYTNFLLVFLLIPLNYFLIKTYGIVGAAWANVIAYLIYNVIRTFFVWKAIGLSPLNSKNTYLLTCLLLVYALALLGLYFFPIREFNLINNILILGLKVVVFLFLYTRVLLALKLSEDLEEIFQTHQILKKLFLVN